MSAWSLAWRTVAHKPARARPRRSAASPSSARCCSTCCCCRRACCCRSAICSTPPATTSACWRTKARSSHRAPLPGAPSLADDIGGCRRFARVALDPLRHGAGDRAGPRGRRRIGDPRRQQRTARSAARGTLVEGIAAAATSAPGEPAPLVVSTQAGAAAGSSSQDRSLRLRVTLAGPPSVAALARLPRRRHRRLPLRGRRRLHRGRRRWRLSAAHGTTGRRTRPTGAGGVGARGAARGCGERRSRRCGPTCASTRTTQVVEQFNRARSPTSGRSRWCCRRSRSRSRSCWWRRC